MQVPQWFTPDQATVIRSALTEATHEVVFSKNRGTVWDLYKMPDSVRRDLVSANSEYGEAAAQIHVFVEEGEGFTNHYVLGRSGDNKSYFPISANLKVPNEHMYKLVLAAVAPRRIRDEIDGNLFAAFVLFFAGSFGYLLGGAGFIGIFFGLVGSIGLFDFFLLSPFLHMRERARVLEAMTRLTRPPNDPLQPLDASTAPISPKEELGQLLEEASLSVQP